MESLRCAEGSPQVLLHSQGVHFSTLLALSLRSPSNCLSLYIPSEHLMKRQDMTSSSHTALALVQMQKHAPHTPHPFPNTTQNHLVTSLSCLFQEGSQMIQIRPFLADSRRILVLVLQCCPSNEPARHAQPKHHLDLWVSSRSALHAVKPAGVLAMAEEAPFSCALLTGSLQKSLEGKGRLDQYQTIVTMIRKVTPAPASTCRGTPN